MTASKCFVFMYFFALLGARHMANPCTNQHQGRVAVWARSHYPRPAADLAVQSLDHVVGTDPGPMLAGKIAVGQSLINAVLHLFGRFLQLHGAQLSNHGLRLLAGRFLALLCVDRLEHFRYNFNLELGHNRENIAVEMHRAALVFGLGECIIWKLLYKSILK